MATPAALTVRQVCEMALQKIGSYSINDGGADGNEMHRAADWLDVAVRHMTGTGRALWLVTTPIEIPLTAGTVSYALLDAMGNSAPADGVLFPVEASIRDSSGNDAPVAVLRHAEYQGIANKDESGGPVQIYIDRLLNNTLYVHPVPTDTSYTLRLAVQTYNARLNDTRNLDKAHGLRGTWDLALVTTLAALIGDGPVRRLRDAEVKGLYAQAASYLDDLDGFENREHADDRKRIAAYYDF